MTDDLLVGLVGWLRAMCGNGAQPGEQERDGWQAYQAALKREQAASQGQHQPMLPATAATTR